MDHIHLSSRRRFIRDMAGGALATLVTPALVQQGFARASARSEGGEKIRVAVIGCGACGAHEHLRALLKNKRVTVMALCDVDALRLESAVRATADMNGAKATGYRDYRLLLERDDLNAVIIATPDHWHATMAIAAMEAGLDVYCEAPLALTLEEGRRMVTMARLYDTVFQTGCQFRSERSVYRNVMEAARAGKIGAVNRIATHLSAPAGGRWGQAEKPPQHLDWDLWLGPAPLADFSSNCGYHDFRRFSDYSGGVIASQGIHFVDLAHQIIGAENSGPTLIEGSGDFDFEGPFDDPTRFDIRVVYGRHSDAELVITSQSGPRFRVDGASGWLAVTERGLEGSNAALVKELNQGGPSAGTSVSAHLEDWLDGIATRSQTAVPAEQGHRANSVCQLANLALQLQRPLEWNPQRESFPAGDPAEWLLSKTERASWRA